MKQLRWIWVLAAAAVLLTVLFIFVDRRSKQQEEQTHVGDAKQLLQIDSDKVTDIKLKNEEGTVKFTWNNTAHTWEITEGDPFNVNVYAVSAICNYACSLRSQKTVAFDCKDTDVYGFQDPITLSIYTTDTDAEHPYIIYVGDSTPTYDSYYAMIDGSNDVYTIDYNSGTVFCSTFNSLKNRYMFDTSTSLVNYYKVEKDGKTVIEMRQNSSNDWEMLQPGTFPLSNSAISDMMNTIVRVQIDAYLEKDPQDLAKYGLDHPHTKLWLEGTLGDMELKEEIWFGDTVTSNEAETQIYGYYANSKQLFRINRAEVSFTDTPITDLMYPYCVEPDITELKSVEIDMGSYYDLHETLHLDYANGQYSLGDLDITAKDDENIMQLFQTFYRTIATLKFSEVHLDEQPDMEKEPAMQIIYTDLNDGKMTLDFIEKDTNDFYLVKDGTYTGLTVRLNRFTSAGSITDRYQMLLAALK